jgi:plasmid stabilization system protein ParE
MKQFKVYISDQAWSDIDNLTDYIRYKLKSPLTALRYANGIINEMLKLGKYADSISKSYYKSVLLYGNNARSINYKKHAVIYTVHKENVIIHRIIIASLIKE